MPIRGLTLVVAPHAPLLLPEVAGPTDPCCASRDALVRCLSRRAGRLFVIVSPHARLTGVYRGASGNLGPFGLPEVRVAATADPLASEVARLWDQPLLDRPVDHGIAVPLALAPEGSFICCGVTEELDHATKHEVGRRLASAVLEATSGVGDVVFLASAQSAASLSPRAPLTERREGAAFHTALTDLLREDPGALAESDVIPEDLWMTGGSCGRAAFAALGTIARSTGVRRMEIFSDEYPVGVGLLVAEG